MVSSTTKTATTTTTTTPTTKARENGEEIWLEDHEKHEGAREGEDEAPDESWGEKCRDDYLQQRRERPRRLHPRGDERNRGPLGVCLG